MMLTAPSILDYERKHREAVLSLLFYSHRTHAHLDWYKVGLWLDMPSTLIQLAYQGDRLVGVLGSSQPLNDSAWLRVVAVANDLDGQVVLGLLWAQLEERLRAAGVRTVAVLELNNWLGPYLPAMGFHYVEDVITLLRITPLLPELPPHNLVLRNGYMEDIPAIVQVDHAAFDPPWQLAATDLRHAQRYVGSSTIAAYEGRIVGYEMSTRHHTSGHLARLAVAPDMQGQKVGAVLLHNLLRKFGKRGVRSMTVNTQISNYRSQRLYKRYGFQRNGFDLPLWLCDL